ncbi:response regulator [Methylobacterium dankookense]|uniref:Blue-light-activated protein n=1 Tax=Methylobacterium dankookense TaxID=560405 RepID=A0A564FWI8_9HYPH|nr:response regulator [Methylobacterium dankookense]GJD56412.1 Regulator of RpoS [Methylobacterium dankookense]VUF12529.1 Blue-light-activated protein [Methylobacterium dankookense]
MGHALPDCPVALVVEDDAAVRDLAAAVLEETDMDVIACESAEAAISVLERPDVNVALLFADVRLPGAMDGLALASTVERRWPDVRVIVTSGYDARADDRLPRQAVFMQKPWRVLDVLVQAEHATLAARAAA